MSFDNGTKLSFFLLLARVMILPFPLHKVSLTLLLLCVTCFFWYTEKQLYKIRATMAYSIGKNHAFLSYHSDESLPF